jgi:hypothetical protein
MRVVKCSRMQCIAVAVVILAGARATAQGQQPPDVDPSSGSHAAANATVGAAAAMPWAEGVPYDVQVKARDLFMEGNVLLRDTLFAAAAAKYEQAIALWPHPAFHYNMALARIHLDQPILAYESMRKAVEHGAAPLGQDRHDHARSYLQLLRNQLAEIEVVCDQAGAQVSLDGKPLFVAPGRYQGLVEPGGHQVVASGEGRIPATEQVVLAPGERARVAIAPLYLRVREQRRWSAWKPWAVAGAGAAVALLGGALQWNTDRQLGAFDRGVGELTCEDPMDGSMRRDCETAELGDADTAARRSATWQQRAALTAYTVGGAAVVTGAVLLMLNRGQPVREYVAQPQAWLMVAPDHVGVAAQLRF